MFKALLFAIVFAAFAIAPKASQAAPVAPPECAAMTFTSTVVATSPVTFVSGSGVILVIGLPNANNTIAVLNAAQACIVGGDKVNSISGSSGDDVIIARGTKNSVNGKLGNDTCYGSGILLCETVLP